MSGQYYLLGTDTHHESLSTRQRMASKMRTK